MSLHPSEAARALAWRAGTFRPEERALAGECAVAITYGRATHAVMLATPSDLEDFAVGFSLSEQVISHPDEIERIEIVPLSQGVELRIDLVPGRAEHYVRRRRMMAGPAGCGLCGAESLESVMRPLGRVAEEFSLAPADVLAALAALDQAQRINAETHGVHGAGFWDRGRGLLAVREDIGRHNALDKLIGALGRAGIAAPNGMVVMTSRVSLELVQKTVRAGAPILAAMSAPSALAVRLADEAGLTLIAIARRDGFEVFSHPERLLGAVEQPLRRPAIATRHARIR
ncbi:MAG TPA: formate dehydrogenase accessory sulfurtransferase FdhD [Acetobacteraceae bacterium]|nr:formate dehydrogenase accessory sulfurtransferase FdhD [Acetobacteraceae bacterium]